MWLCVCKCACWLMHGDQPRMLGIYSTTSYINPLETLSLTGPGMKLASGKLVDHPPLEHPHSGFYVGAGDLNSCLPAGTASTLIHWAISLVPNFLQFHFKTWRDIKNFWMNIIIFLLNTTLFQGRNSFTCVPKLMMLR